MWRSRVIANHLRAGNEEGGRKEVRRAEGGGGWGLEERREDKKICGRREKYKERYIETHTRK